MLSLVAGFWLPFGGAVAPDADGICGPVLVLERSVRHFESTPSPVGPTHCAFCHWRHTMAGAATTEVVAVIRPWDVAQPAAGPAANGPAVVVIGDRVPRSPPALS